MDSLHHPRPEEIFGADYEFIFKEAKDLSTEQILNILRGKENSYLDRRDLKEVLLRRNVVFDPEESSNLSLKYFFILAILLCIFAFFGWKLFQSLKDREKKREEKKKQKQKKKK